MTRNRWLFITIYCLVGLLVVATVVCGLVKTSYKPQIANPTIINIQDNDYAKYPSVGSREQNPERYDAVMDAFNKSFEESFLTSVFSGRNGTTTRIIQHGTTDPRKNFSGFKVQFIFGEEQTIMLNGEEYYPATDTSKTIKYKEIIFEVNMTNAETGEAAEGFIRNSIYYVSQNEVTGKDEYYEHKLLCDFSGLYELLLTY